MASFCRSPSPRLTTASGADQAAEGAAGGAERLVVGAVHEVGGDDARLDVAVVQPADAQDVLVGARVELGRDLGVDERRLQRRRRRLGRLERVEVELEAVGERAQRVDVHPVREPLDDVLGDHVLLRQRLERLALQHRRGLAVGVAAGLEARVLERDLHQVGVELVAVLQVLLVLAELHLVERRLGDVDVAALDQLGHLPEQERQQQRADVRAVDVGVGHDDDAVVAQLGDVEVVAAGALADAGAERGDQRQDLVARDAASRSAPSRR